MRETSGIPEEVLKNVGGLSEDRLNGWVDAGKWTNVLLLEQIKKEKGQRIG